MATLCLSCLSSFLYRNYSIDFNKIWYTRLALNFVRRYTKVREIEANEWKYEVYFSVICTVLQFYISLHCCYFHLHRYKNIATIFRIRSSYLVIHVFFSFHALFMSLNGTKWKHHVRKENLITEYSKTGHSIQAYEREVWKTTGEITWNDNLPHRSSNWQDDNYNDDDLLLTFSCTLKNSKCSRCHMHRTSCSLDGKK
jgi:hypothetical protein